MAAAGLWLPLEAVRRRPVTGERIVREMERGLSGSVERGNGRGLASVALWQGRGGRREEIKGYGCWERGAEVGIVADCCVWSGEEGRLWLVEGEENKSKGGV